MRLFKKLDGLFHRANQNRFTKGIVLIKEHQSLPRYEPIAWRETTKTTLGSIRYLIRILLVIEFPVAVICLLAVAQSNASYYQSHRSGPVSCRQLHLLGDCDPAHGGSFRLSCCG